MNWSTATEEVGDYFIIERSNDGRQFEKIATITSKGIAAAYSYSDEHPIQGWNYYRLQLMNASGQGNYSQIVSAKAENADAFTIDAFPNPVKNLLTVVINDMAGDDKGITITDVKGSVLQQAPLLSNKTEINMEGLPAGIYFIRYADAERVKTIKINKE